MQNPHIATAHQPPSDSNPWGGTFNTWLIDDVAPPRGFYKFTPAHRTFLSHVQINQLRGDLGEIFLSWELPPNPDLIKQFFVEMNASNAILSFWDTHSRALIRKLKPIYLPLHCGRPFSATIAQLSRTDRLKGLFVQFFGSRNAVPCSRCEHAYASTVVRPNGQIDGNGCLTMSPFFECKSLIVGEERFDHGRCGRCLFKVCSPFFSSPHSST